MNFVVANYELLNGLSRGLTIICNLMILLKKKRLSILFSPSLSHSFTLSQITLDCFKKLVSK